MNLPLCAQTEDDAGIKKQRRGRWSTLVQQMDASVAAMDAKPYTRTLQDELDWKLLDQLYGVVAQISSFCFDTKKFCVTTELLVLALLVRFTRDRLDNSILIAALVIPLCFWFLDATGYFYQVKLRGTMDSIRHRIAERDQMPLLVSDGSKVIAAERTSAPIRSRLLEAVFNHSMWLYAVLVVVDLFVWGIFEYGGIK
jgi:hypothetical protein